MPKRDDGPESFNTATGQLAEADWLARYVQTDGGGDLINSPARPDPYPVDCKRAIGCQRFVCWPHCSASVPQQSQARGRNCAIWDISRLDAAEERSSLMSLAPCPTGPKEPMTNRGIWPRG